MAKPLGLPADVRPGGLVRVTLDLRIPLIPGPYVVSAGLAQVGDGPLARCGVAPLHVPVEVLPPQLVPRGQPAPN